MYHCFDSLSLKFIQPKMMITNCRQQLDLAYYDCINKWASVIVTLLILINKV
jgi:hypothetical protein